MEDIKENSGNGNGDLELLKKKNEEAIARNINNFKEFINDRTVLTIRFNKETNTPEWITTLTPHGLNFLLDSIKLNLLLPKPPKIIKPEPKHFDLKNLVKGAFGGRLK